MKPFDNMTEQQRQLLMSELPFFNPVPVPPPIEVDNPPETPRIDSDGTPQHVPKRGPGRPRKTP
jgi:hypothetical protein